MASGTRRILTEVPAAGVFENILQGLPLEYPGVPSRVEIAATCEAAAAGDLTMDVVFGTDTVGEALLIGIEDAAGRGPRLPDDVILVDALAGVDHLQIRLRNANVAIMDVTTLVRVQPV